METSQDYSVITTEITEDYQVFKQELTNNGEETTMMGETDSNATNKLDKEKEVLERKYEDAKNILYLCPRYKFQTTWKGYLKLHTQSVHDGIRYPCPHCDYQATLKGELNKHIKSIHDGVKYPCPHCDYQATEKGSLKKHIQSQHVNK